MKINKFWSILMMFFLMLGTTIAFSSCSKDDDVVTPSNLAENLAENIMIVGGHSYKIIGAAFEGTSSGSELIFSTSNGAEMELKFDSETLPVGKEVAVRKIEFEVDDYEVKSRITNYISIQKSGSQYIISFSEIAGYDSDGKIKYMHLNYQGKVY